MRKIIPLVIVALAVTVFWFRDLWLPNPPGLGNYLGYVEGETILIGAPQAGRLSTVNARDGEGVTEGTVLFRLDSAVLELELARAEQAVKTAAAIHADLLTGKREAELAAIRAEALEADAGLVLARKERDRAASLAHTGTAAQSRLDAAQAQVATFEARIARIKASEAAAMLPARPEDIAAAHSRVEEARAAAAEIRQRIADLAPRAPVTAEVEDAFFSAGEWVAAGQPVVSLLQPGEMTLRFFVPEAALSLAQPGQEIRYTCDGCGDLPGRGRIVRTASTPEFTPPVIYSQGARAKLVFRVEAKPQDARSLRPGLPIEVEPLQ